MKSQNNLEKDSSYVGRPSLQHDSGGSATSWCECKLETKWRHFLSFKNQYGQSCTNHAAGAGLVCGTVGMSNLKYVTES